MDSSGDEGGFGVSEGDRSTPSANVSPANARPVTPPRGVPWPPTLWGLRPIGHGEMYDRLLAAVTDEHVSDAVFAEAIGIASPMDAMVRGLYVIPYRPVFTRYGYSGLPAPGDLEKEQARGRALFERGRRAAAAEDVHFRGVIVRGEPVKRIVTAARDYRADAVVMAGRGHDGFGLSIRPSPAERVHRGAASTVIMVPPDAETGHALEP